MINQNTQKEFKEDKSKDIDEIGGDKYAIKHSNSVFNIHRSRGSDSNLSNPIQNNLHNNNSSHRGNLHTLNNNSSELYEGEDVAMPKIKTSTKIKRWFNENWKLIIVILLVLLFFYMLAGGKIPFLK